MDKPTRRSPEAEAEVDGWLRTLGDAVLQEEIPQRLLAALGVYDETAPTRRARPGDKPGAGNQAAPPDGDPASTALRDGFRSIGAGGLRIPRRPR
jgi:hypothetical protein